MLTGVCIIVAELCLLFRLALPHILDFAEQRFAEVYGERLRPQPLCDDAHGDCFPFVAPLNVPSDHDTKGMR